MRTEDFQVGVAQSAQKFISATPIFWLLGDIKSSYNQSFNKGGGLQIQACGSGANDFRCGANSR